MANISSKLKQELERIASGSFLTSAQNVGTVRFLVRCQASADIVLEKAKLILAAIDSAALRGWPSHDAATPALPEWFTSACAPEKSDEEADQWLKWWKSLPRGEQQRVDEEKIWSLANWLYWMEPENRQWFWWDASVQKGSNEIALSVEVEGWPFPWGALRWLFRAAGASTIVSED